MNDPRPFDRPASTWNQKVEPTRKVRCPVCKQPVAHQDVMGHMRSHTKETS